MSTETKPPTPREAVKEVRAIIKASNGDPESQHSKTDTYMEDLLVKLGYEDVVNAIKETKRWYA